MRRLIIFAGFLFVGVAALAANLFLGHLAEDDHVTAEQAFEAKVARFKAASDVGSSDAQLGLALVYLNAAEGRRDLGKAVALLSRASEQGNIEATFLLGRAYQIGMGVDQDVNRAARLYTRIVRVHDHAPAQFALGMMYFRGQGTGQNDVEAATWISRAADNAYPAAQYMMGRLNEAGFDGEPDLITAYMWFTLADQERDRVRAFDSRFDTQSALAALANKMNRNQIEAAEKAAAAWPG